MYIGYSFGFYSGVCVDVFRKLGVFEAVFRRVVVILEGYRW